MAQIICFLTKITENMFAYETPEDDQRHWIFLEMCYDRSYVVYYAQVFAMHIYVGKTLRN